MTGLRRGTIYFVDKTSKRFDGYDDVDVKPEGVYVAHRSPASPAGPPFMRHFYPACHVRLVEWSG